MDPYPLSVLLPSTATYLPNKPSTLDKQLIFLSYASLIINIRTIELRQSLSSTTFTKHDPPVIQAKQAISILISRLVFNKQPQPNSNYNSDQDVTPRKLTIANHTNPTVSSPSTLTSSFNSSPPLAMRLSPMNKIKPRHLCHPSISSITVTRVNSVKTTMARYTSISCLSSMNKSSSLPHRSTSQQYNSYINYFCILKSSLLSNKQKLQLLNKLHRRHRNHHVIPRASIVDYVNLAQHEQIICFGASYSSDLTGDGPPNPQSTPIFNQLDPTFEPTNAIYIPWSSFTTWHDSYNALPLPVDEYVIIGKYIRLYSTANIITRASVFCPALNSTFVISPTWIRDYGYQSQLQSKTILSATILREHTPTEHLLVTLPTILPGSILQQEENPSTDLLDGIITEITHQQISSSNLGISTWNVNGLSSCGHLPLLVWLSRRVHLDINVLIDTRHRTTSHSFNQTAWEADHPSGKVIHSTITPTQKSGGSMILLNGQWASRYHKSWDDPSDLGIIHESLFRLDNSLLRVIVIYWPIPAANHTDSSQQLDELLRKWLSTNRPHQSPEQYIRSMILSRIKHKSAMTILLGDLNTLSNSERSSWITNLGLHDAHATGSSFFSRYSGMKPTSRIDFVYSSHPSLGYGHSDDTIFLSQSDHCPIWANYSVAASDSPTRKKIHQQRFKPINYTNDDHKNTMLIAVAAECDSLPPTETSLATIIESIVVNNRTPVNKKDRHCWTPSAAVDFICLAAFQKINRSPSRFLEYALQAKGACARIGKDGCDLWDSQAYRLQALITNKIQPPQAYTDGSICLLRKELQGRRRKEKLELFREIRLKREDPKFLFKGLGQQREVIDLSRLVIGETIVTEPADIHQHVVNNFASIFSQHCFHDIQNMWSKVQEYPSFLDTFCHASIPESLKQSLFNSIHAPSSKRHLVAKDLAPLRFGPTLEQFVQEIKLSSSTSAPGKSGLTYRMLKHQSPLIILKLYDILLASWKENKTPTLLNFKLLYMLPKKPGDNSLGNIRPIVLIETLRKLWVGCIVRQVRHSWEKNNILHPTQYGFRARRSCSSCLVQLINLTESAREHNHPLFFSSWDLRKAFDSVPRPIIQLALCRLGVPLHLANYLAFIDMNDHIQPCTPYANEHEEASFFTTLRGTGQGDKGSPSIWVAVMDMILTAVDEIPSDLHYQGSNGAVHTAKDLAYADDFVSFSRTHETLQQKANIFAATATLLGLEVATEKFRTGIVNADCRSHPPLVVHNSSWSPITVSYAMSHITLKYLGSNQDMNLSTSSELQRLKKVIKKVIQSLRYKIGSSKSKIKYIQGALFPRIAYPASFTNCSLSELQQLDKEIKTHLKALSNVSKSWPNKLLYAEAKDGGLGLPLLSDYIQSVKISIMQRSLLGDPYTHNSMDSLLYRRCTNPHMYMELTVKSSTGTWSSSLSTYLQEEKLSIMSSSKLQRNHLDDPIREYFPELPPSILQTLGDITEWHNGTPYLVPLYTIQQAGIDTGTAMWSPISVNESINNRIILPSATQQMLAPGQHWLLHVNNRQPTIITITGWSKLDVSGWVWASQPGSFRANKSYNLTRTNHISIAWNVFSPTHRVLISAPIRDHLSLIATTILFIKASPTPRPFAQVSPPFPEAPLLCNTNTICTDGSWNKIYNGPFESLAVTTAGAAIAIMDSVFTQGFVIKNHLQHSYERAFTQEAVALVVGLAIHRFNQLQHPVFSDCDSLVKLTVSKLRLHSKSTSQLIQLSRHLARDNSSVKWVPAHLEQSNNQPIHEIGNAYADRIADGRQSHNVTDLLPTTLCNIAHWTHHWFIGNSDGPSLLQINHQRNARITADYFTNRINDHPLSPPQQAVSELIRIHKAFTAKQRGAILKLILSKFDDDRIYLQWTADNHLTSPIMCECGCCNTLASWTNHCSEPKVVEHRNETLQSVYDLLQEHGELRTYIMDAISSNPEPLWRGIWSTQQMTDISEIMATSPLSDDNWKRGRKLIDKITLTITSGALLLHTNHSSSKTRYNKPTMPTVTTPTLTEEPATQADIRVYLHPVHTAYSTDVSPANHPNTYRPTSKDRRNKQILEASKTPSICGFFSRSNGIHKDSTQERLAYITRSNTQRLARMDEFFPAQVVSPSSQAPSSTVQQANCQVYQGPSNQDGPITATSPLTMYNAISLPCSHTLCMSMTIPCSHVTTNNLAHTTMLRQNMTRIPPSPGHSAPRTMDISLTRPPPSLFTPPIVSPPSPSPFIPTNSSPTPFHPSIT